MKFIKSLWVRSQLKVAEAVAAALIVVMCVGAGYLAVERAGTDAPQTAQDTQIETVTNVHEGVAPVAPEAPVAADDPVYTIELPPLPKPKPVRTKRALKKVAPKYQGRTNGNFTVELYSAANAGGSLR